MKQPRTIMTRLHAMINTDTNLVENIVTSDSTMALKLHLDNNMQLWDCTQFDVSIGDTFIDGVFYSESVPVAYVPTIEEKQAQLEVNITESRNITNELLLESLMAKGAIV